METQLKNNEAPARPADPESKRFSDKEIRQKMWRLSLKKNFHIYRKLAIKDPGMETLKFPFRALRLFYELRVEPWIWK